MASNDLKNDFAERIKKRRASMEQTKKLDDVSQSSIVGATATNEGKASFVDRITKRKSELGLDTAVDETFINTFLTDADKYLASAMSSYNSLGYSNAASTYDSQVDTVKDLRSRYGAVSRYLKKNKDSYSTEDYDTIISQLDSFSKAMNDYQSAFYIAKNYYSQWDTEQDYTRWENYHGKSYSELSAMLEDMEDGEEKDWLSSYASSVDYEEKSNFDIESGETEISELEAYYSDVIAARDVLWDNDHNPGSYTEEAVKAATKQYTEFVNKYGDINGLETAIQDKKLYLENAKRIQEGITLSGVANPESENYDPDFEQYSGYVSTEQDSGWDKVWSQYGMGYDDLTYEYINNQNGIRDDIKHKYRLYAADGNNPYDSSLEEEGYDYMTDDQVAIYNYYYSKDGKEAAEKYLDSIRESLHYQKATAMYENMEDKTLLELAFGVAAGLDQFESGMKGLFNAVTGNDEYVAQSATQMASGMVREDLGDAGFKLPDWIGGASIGQVAYDSVTTTANMLPSIMTSTAVNLIAPGAGAIAGTAMLGSSAGGNAYQEMINLGYNKGQAQAYAVMVGASEAGLEYLLGGISKLGGKVSGNVVSNLVSKVDNAIARTAIKLGGNMASEFTEEYLQEVLTPWFQNIALGTHNDINLISADALYSGLLGALTAGFLEGGSTISGEVNTYKTGKILQEANISAQRLSELGKTFSADTVAYQLAGRVDENTGAYTLGRLFNEIGAELTEKNKTDIASTLVASGVKAKDAKVMADAFAAVAVGGVFTDEQVAMIEANDTLAKAVVDVLINENSTVYQRSQGYNQVLMDLAKEKSSSDTTRTNPASQNEENTPASDEVDTGKEIASEGHYEVSTDGKTILNSTGDTVNIKEIASIKDGQMTLRLDDGSEVNASDVSYSTQDEALVYEAVADMGVNASAANVLVNAYIPGTGLNASAYTLGIKEAYRYGQYSYPVQEVATAPFASMLTEHQRQTAYKLGKIFGGEKVAKEQATIRKNQNVSKDSSATGKVHFDGDRNNLTERQRASLSAMETVAEALGVQIYVFESKVDENGRHIGANGWYDPKDGSIHIDLYAGANGESTMLFTAAHELIHFIKQWSPAKFKTLANFLMKEYGKKGVSVESLVQAQIAKAKRNGRTISYDTAYEEVIADSMETMLSDGKVVEKLAKLKTQDKSLWQKIKNFITGLAAKIRKVYEGLSPDSVEGRYAAEMKESIEKLQNLFAEGLVEASENYQASEQVLAESGIAVDSNTDAGSIFSVRDVLDDGDRKKVAAALAERFEVTEDEAMKWLTAETSLASLILNPKYSAFLDYEADPGETAIKQNSDYPQGTVDFSNICKKRREFTQVMNRILRNFPNHVFAATDLAKIRTIMGEEGMTLPCGICYVEDRRQLDTIVAQDFIEGLKLYREGSKTRPDGKPFNANQLKGLQLTDGDTYVPTIYELVSLEGRNSLKAKNPNMEAAWVRYNNARGMQSVRLLTNEAEYKRQILKYSKKTVQSKNDHGGLRIYSFSDAEMFHLIDIVQVITDSATVGLSLQGYTKVNEYAKAVKDTGEKLNRSLIPKGDLGYHIENGKVVLDYDTVEGIDITSKDFFDNKDNPNVGNITIGVNDTQIRAAMVSDFVDQIIPFHTGQSEDVLGEKGIAAWKNYKDYQTEKDIATGKTSSHQVNIYTEVIQAAEDEGKPIQNKKQFVEKFLEVCKENGLQPRFAQFLNTDAQGEYIYTEGYHKFLVDFKTFAQTEVGEYLPQMPVKPIFDDAYISGLLADYVKEQQAKDAEVAKQMPMVIERITNEIIKADTEAEAKYSTREYAKQVDEVKNNTHDPKNHVYMGTTPVGVASILELPKLPMLVTSQHIYSMAVSEKIAKKESRFRSRANYHDLGWDAVKKLPEYIDKPVLIIKSNTDPTDATFVVVTGHTDKTGNPIIVAVKPNGKGKYFNIEIPTNIVLSGYGKDGIQSYVAKAKNENRILYASKKNSQKNKANPSVQFADVLLSSDYTANLAQFKRIVKSKFVGTIFENSGLPKFSNRDSDGNQLSEEQQVFFKDSVVRDADGKLMVMYHGTANGGAFTIFDGDKLGNDTRTTQIGQGFYFTNVKKEAESYTKNVDIYGKVSKGHNPHLHQVYLNITNPFDITADKLDIEKVKAVYMDGTYDYFFNSWIPFYLNKKAVNGSVLTKAEVQAMSKAEKVSVYVDYLSGLGTKELLNNMVRAFPYGNQSELLTSMKKQLGYDGLVEEFKPGQYQYVAFSSEQVKDTGNKNPTASPDIRYSERDTVPTFYSQMARVIDGVKQEKLGAASVVNMLRGKGVKAEEIKWSGIETWLDGKKSVTKAELQEFIAGSMLQIAEERSSNDVDLRFEGNNTYKLYDAAGNVLDTFKYSEFMGGYISEATEEIYSYTYEIEDAVREEYGSQSMPRWGDHKLRGGSNYREIVFRLPNSSYSNQAMRIHWGDDAEGVLAHARIQDFVSSKGKMLFIEEIQSDWHNEGAKSGYTDSKVEAKLDELKAISDKRFLAVEDYSTEMTGIAGEWETIEKTEKGAKLLREYREAQNAYDSAMDDAVKKIPDAPFRNNYHEYVLKRLIREAAEQGYTRIGWTTADTQSRRWSEDYAEGYRIEYDQDIPKFLNKYGKKWGAGVGKTTVNGTDVWYMDITDSMRDSVLTEGQPLYQERVDDSVSNRSLLANAFEGVAQNDIERNKIQEYKGKIGLLNSEEQKLHELREQIKDLSFAKGPKDTEKIKSLQFDAMQTANRISTLDKTLLRLEASSPLQAVLDREKKMAYKRAEQKGKEALAAYREKATKTQREIIERYQESRKKGIENREKTAMRHKIQSVVGELNQLLLNDDKKRHVPENLKKAVADALVLVNMDTVGAEERAAKYASLIAKETDPDKIDAYTVTMENILRQGEKMGQRLKELRDAYEEISDSDDPDIANAYDPVIAGNLKELAQSIGNTSLRNMTIDQLQDVYNMYKMVLTRVRDANKSFLNEKKETISNQASRVVGEVRRVGGEHKYRASILDPANKFIWDNQKPIYAMEKIGSDTLTDAFMELIGGEGMYATDVSHASKFADEKKAAYKYDSWDFKKKYKFESTSGLEFELTLEQILSLYAYSKREQASDHLRLGGFVFDSNIETYKEDGNKLLKYKVNTADAHQLTPEILTNITGKLTKEQMAFVDEMQEYLSTTMGAKGNEVTMKMYGVKLFKEKFYFPLKSAKQFMFEQNEVAGEVKIKNSGFTNKVVAKANNPVILSNFMDVWANHVHDMSMYHSFVLPLEDFNRIFNYNSPKKEGQPSVSVKGTIQSAYGPAATNYVKQLITDLNGGARSDPRESTAKALMGRFKKAAVFASNSVVIQQPSAVLRAQALVDAKYFDLNPKLISMGKLWEEAKQYAPVAIIKEMGYFDMDTSRSTVDYIKGDKTIMDKVDDVLSLGPAKADEWAWVQLWAAVKKETAAKNKDLKVGSDEFLKAAGKRFTEVIVKTQVYDSTLSRSANMRSKSALMSMATAFMAEPTTSINMLENGVRMWKRGYKKAAVKQFSAVYASVIANALLVSLVYAMRDDDEDETFLEKYFGSVTAEILEGFNPLTYYPWLKDGWSLLQGYDVERSDMSLLNDVFDALNKVGSLAFTDTEDMDEDELAEYKQKVKDSAWTLVDGVAGLLGIPVKNIRRDIDSYINLARTSSNGIVNDPTSFWNEVAESVKDSIPFLSWGGDDSKTDKLYEAIVNGDTAYLNRLKSGYETESAYNTAIRKALRENDSRIHEAAVARNNGDLDEYMRIAKEIIAEGHFSQDNVVAAVNAEINAISNDESSSSNTQKASGMFKAEDFATAISQGDSAMANAIKTDIIQTAQKNGKTEEEAEKSFISSATDSTKEAFLNGDISESKAVSALVTYLGKTEDEAYADVMYWKFQKDYPDIDASSSWFDKYYADIEDSGISLNVYINYRSKVADITGEDKKEKRMSVINSLPITNSQKDALYLAEGWAESKLDEAPWH